MVNIFNLFLFLFALWSLFMGVSGHLSWFYIIFGLLSSALVSFLAFRLKLIEEKSELLYLSFGFYRHFIFTYLGNFIASIGLLMKIAFSTRSLEPLIHTIELNNEDDFNPALLATHCNLTAGLFSIAIRKNELLVHAISDAHFAKLDIKRVLRSLHNVNDDNII